MKPEKLNFINTPTPLHRLDNMSEEFGLNLYMKRDDLTNYGTGGNKLRKLEYLVADAVRKGATMLLTVGGAQTNHGRLTAATACRYRMKSAIVAVDDQPDTLSGNLLLDSIMGCHVYIAAPKENISKDELLKKTIQEVTEYWEAKGEKVYFIPLGGSNALGSLGYYDCTLELKDQINEMELENPHIITTIGSIGTYTGLLAGIANENIQADLTGITIFPYTEKEEEKQSVTKAHALKIYNEMKQDFGLKASLTPDDLDIITDYDCGGYNNPVAEVREAICYLAETEGIFLDPCYTGKSFAGILDLIKQGSLKKEKNYIILHTGGIPGLYTPHHRAEFEKDRKEYIHFL